MLKQRGRSCGSLVDKSLSPEARQPSALGLEAAAHRDRPAPASARLSVLDPSASLAAQGADDGGRSRKTSRPSLSTFGGAP
jgi:hypothetical protein